MENIFQAIVVKLNYVHAVHGVYEFHIPNNTPVEEAVKALQELQNVLINHITKSTKKENEPCKQIDPSESST